MKVLIALVAALAAPAAWPCVNKLPESEVVKNLALQGSQHPKTCAEASEEPCLCFDGIEWDAAKLSEDLEPYDTTEEDGTVVTRMRVVKRLVADPEKVAAKAAKAKAEDDARKAKAEARAARRAKIESMDVEGATTIAKLREIVKALVEEERERK